MAAIGHPIREAERYLQNARQLLTDKAEKDGDYYNMRMSHCIKLWGMMEIKITGLFKPL